MGGLAFDHETVDDMTMPLGQAAHVAGQTQMRKHVHRLSTREQTGVPKDAIRACEAIGETLAFVFGEFTPGVPLLLHDILNPATKVLEDRILGKTQRLPVASSKQQPVARLPLAHKSKLVLMARLLFLLLVSQLELP